MQDLELSVVESDSDISRLMNKMVVLTNSINAARWAARAEPPPR
jgi:hypothetical protein